MNNQLKELVSKKVIKTEWDDLRIVFYLEDGTHIGFNAYAQCCNDVTINDIDDDSVLQDCIILDAQEEEQFDDDDEVEWVFYKFKTNKGYSTLSLRNQPGSSGYYYAGYLRKMDSSDLKSYLRNKE